MEPSATSRRDFVIKGASAAAALSLAPGVFAEGREEIRVALVGCGGRGTGAAQQALAAHPSVRIVALADGFRDRLEDSLKNLQKAGGERVDVPEERRFVGLDAYKAAIDAADVALLASPPRFRPDHLEHAVAAGKHCFVEKPVATDAPGARRVAAACEAAKAKKLSMVSGLCWRYHAPRVETMNRVRDGAIGRIVAVETIYNAGGVWEPRITRAEAKSEMELQLRNWYYHAWIGGDHIVEQAVHGLDTMGWALGDDPPAVCWGTGGRQVRTAEKYGDIWDHFSLVYEYASGVRGYHQCRHWPGASRVKDLILGTRGVCDVFDNSIAGEAAWKYSGPPSDMYQSEINALFESIRSGQPINNGKYMVNSTMLAIMGRMAAYSGQAVTWEQAWNSDLDLGPSRPDWGDAPKPVIPVPGQGRYF